MSLNQILKTEMDLSDDLVLKKKGDVIKRFGEELLLFDSSEGKLFEVNETGKTIWSMLDGKHTVKEIKEKLEEEFEGIQEIDRDLSDFLKRLHELDLIEKPK